MSKQLYTYQYSAVDIWGLIGVIRRQKVNDLQAKQSFNNVAIYYDF